MADFVKRLTIKEFEQRIKEKLPHKKYVQVAKPYLLYEFLYEFYVNRRRIEVDRLYKIIELAGLAKQNYYNYLTYIKLVVDLDIYEIKKGDGFFVNIEEYN